jgi:hypothetical protein
MDHGLCFTRGSLDFHAYSDSDWAGDPEDRCSTTDRVSFRGVQKRSLLSLAIASRLNIELWLWLWLNFIGRLCYSKTYNFLYYLLPLSGVITLGQSPWLSILSSTPVPNILRLMCTSFVKGWPTKMFI